MDCNIRDMDLNPPLIIDSYKLIDNSTINVIDDGKLLGGTKQRALIRFVDYYKDYDEFVYAGPSIGFAQVALTIACVKMNKKITLFIQNTLDYIPNLTFWCQTLGANVFIYYDKLSNIEESAKYYVETKETKPFLIPFGLESPIYTNFLYEELLRVIPPELNPKRLWLVVGSGTLLRVLARIWNKTEFFPIQVGKQIWEDQYDPEVWTRMGGRERIDQLKAPQKFFESVYGKNLPPYESVANYDSKVWQQVVKYAKDGDYIWNVASDSNIFKCDYGNFGRSQMISRNPAESPKTLDHNFPHRLQSFDSITNESDYRIKSSDYISEDLGSGDKYINGARELIPLVRDNTIWFPFHRYMSLPPNVLFKNLSSINLQVKHDRYKLKSYSPPNGFYFPPLFRGKPTTIMNEKNNIRDADVLSDYFIEDIRLRSKRHDQIYSILQCWEMDECLEIILATGLKTKEYITPLTLRDTIYETMQETGTFSPTRARALVKMVLGENVRNKKWLDISAGWGDRLLAAMSLDMIYTGFDPNVELKQGHDEMIKSFGQRSPTSSTGTYGFSDNFKQKIYYEPFEKAEITDGPYDIILTSPPFFDVEKYSIDQKGQSILSYPKFNDWVVNFLFASLIKAWNNLKEGGFLMLHLGDTVKLNISEMTNIFIENNLPGASWEGVIGISSEYENYRPVWCYKKLARNANLQRWKSNKPSFPRTLYYYYPEIQKELIKFYSRLLISDNIIYEIDEKVVTVKNKLYEYYPDLLNEINGLLDDQILAFVIKGLGMDSAIKWSVAMIKLSLL